MLLYFTLHDDGDNDDVLVAVAVACDIDWVR